MVGAWLWLDSVFFATNRSCVVYETCGPYGVCDINTSPYMLPKRLGTA